MFYDVFKQLCDKKGVSPSRACLDMKLSRSLAAKWKNTGANPSFDVLSKIATYFGVTTDYLLNISDGKNKTKELDLDNDIIIINRAAQKMSPEKRNKMMTMLQIAFEKEFSDEDESDNKNNK